MTDRTHLDHAELVGYIDGELDAARAEAVRHHLASCGACLDEHGRLTDISRQIRAFVASAQTEGDPVDDRIFGAKLAAAQMSVSMAGKNAGTVLRRFGWGMALAASIAIALMFVPYNPAGEAPRVEPALAARTQTASLDVNGESFVALPYSNPDLPLSAPRIVEMQVPVSSLAAAGITLGSTVGGSPERTVRANVLLGIDGQPLGLHVLTAD